MQSPSIICRLTAGLLGGLCLLVQPLMACMPCCSGNNADCEQTKSTCCVMAERRSTSSCCQPRVESGVHSTSQCCGSCTCCQPPPVFPALPAGHREMTQQYLFASVSINCVDQPSVSARPVGNTASFVDGQLTLSQRLATLCVWRN